MGGAFLLWCGSQGQVRKNPRAGGASLEGPQDDKSVFLAGGSLRVALFWLVVYVPTN